MEDHFRNLSKLSRGEYSLEEVLAVAGVVADEQVDTQPRTEKEWAEDHAEAERYETEKI